MFKLTLFQIQSLGTISAASASCATLYSHFLLLIIPRFSASITSSVYFVFLSFSLSVSSGFSAPQGNNDT